MRTRVSTCILNQLTHPPTLFFPKLDRWCYTSVTAGPLHKGASGLIAKRFTPDRRSNNSYLEWQDHLKLFSDRCQREIGNSSRVCSCESQGLILSSWIKRGSYPYSRNSKSLNCTLTKCLCHQGGKYLETPLFWSSHDTLHRFIFI